MTQNSSYEEGQLVKLNLGFEKFHLGNYAMIISRQDYVEKTGRSPRSHDCHVFYQTIEGKLGFFEPCIFPKLNPEVIDPIEEARIISQERERLTTITQKLLNNCLSCKRVN
jgi:hypothetical protein